MKARLRRGFNVSVAELDEAVTCQSATLGLAAVSASRDYLRGQMEQLERASTRWAEDLGAEVKDCFWDFADL
jgi:uncharacterized protein YlxP (DUF503 family)